MFQVPNNQKWEKLEDFYVGIIMLNTQTPGGALHLKKKQKEKIYYSFVNAVYLSTSIN